MSKFKIEVKQFSKYQFLWCLMENTGNKWCNCGAGWEANYNKAMESAYNYYTLYIKCLNIK